MIVTNIIGPRKVNLMSPSSLAQHVLEITSIADEQARALREKYNIQMVNILKDHEYLKEEGPLADPLVEYLNQYELADLKKLHVLAKVGEQPDRLKGGSRSLRDVFMDLELTPPGTPPHKGDKQSYIEFFKNKIFRLPVLLTDSFDICREHEIDPDEELAKI
ncbi:hypothetical protein [Marinobacter nauticus]|uniref:hypothetical protein n=1 Tax=Marinobacter nauticus TaxID=2743 RepID=UPI001C99B13A|nr:hypothetical protein [Marinobacter nauticus]MBY5938105.1 hypothetical protein [Marinobacter nauticus]MBY5955334.1 hypothetical protein [Marinobacter nauticus]MBY6009125.1 hypothetical protein [Marinobacter nauticus]